MSLTPKIIVVAGPTASGKSDFAVEYAEEYNGEIISADSRQIYRGLDLSTGKITETEMRGVPHYMLSICNPDDTFSVAEYKRLAMPLVEDIISRGKTPILCGGTGQYIDALIFDQDIPTVGPNIELRKVLEQKSTEELYEELMQKDRRRAEQIDKHNKVRLVRALEIITTLGKVPAQTVPAYRYPTKIYLMDISRELLRERITKRLSKRLDAGMIDEVKNINSQSVTMQNGNLTARKFGLEYVAITKFLKGEITEEEMKEEIITRSVQYAKREQTWNKKYLQDATLIKIT